MKLIIAGSRKIDERETLKIIRDALPALPELKQATEIVSGCCSGVDKGGELYAKTIKLPVKKFPANWFQFGKKAGPKRNKEMAEYADVLLLIWDGKSKGSESMRYQARRAKIPVIEIRPPQRKGER